MHVRLFEHTHVDMQSNEKKKNVNKQIHLKSKRQVIRYVSSPFESVCTILMISHRMYEDAENQFFVVVVVVVLFTFLLRYFIALM